MSFLNPGMYGIVVGSTESFTTCAALDDWLALGQHRRANPTLPLNTMELEKAHRRAQRLSVCELAVDLNWMSSDRPRRPMDAMAFRAGICLPGAEASPGTPRAATAPGRSATQMRH